jgi:hypothetical protein
MSWDLNEPESLTQGRLMTAAPEFVFEQLRFYGENVTDWNGKKELEKLLLTRDNKLIDLALAQYATDKSIVGALYSKADGSTSKLDNEHYDRGLRVACLSNRHFSYFNWPDFDLTAIMSKGFTPEAAALLRNPSVPSSVLVTLFTKTESFIQVEEKHWLWMIQIAADNERINIDKSAVDGPDLDLWDIQKAIFAFLEITPISAHSARVTMNLLHSLDPAHTTWPASIDHLLQRWSHVELKNHKGEDDEGWLTHLSYKDELRCLIAAVFTRRSTSVKGAAASFGSPGDTDIALRCAFYAGDDLTEKDIKVGFDKDKDVFVFAVLKNRYILLHPKKRALIETFISGRLIREYQRRCEQLRKKHPSFDTRPVSEMGRELVEVERNESNTNAFKLDAVRTQLDYIAGSISRYERRIYWIIFVFMVGMYFILKK